MANDFHREKDGVNPRTLEPEGCGTRPSLRQFPIDGNSRMIYLRRVHRKKKIYVPPALAGTSSNGEPGQLRGPFQTYNVDVGLIVLNFSFQMACSQGVCQYSLNPGVPGTSYGVGLLVTAYKTNTAVATTGCEE